jgi:hypothetical protein
MRLANGSIQTSIVKARSNVKNNRGIGINNFTNSNQIKIYPNPANNELLISLSKNCNNSQILIMNVLGETIKNISTTNTETKINISEIENGVYFVKVNTNGSSFLQKLVIQH